ncbi:LRV FeS4 cluster domain-containing protein, partial [mine drainage metagenome]
MEACVEDRYAKRIDRFFDWNPGTAKNYLGHPYFEVRAVAAKHVEVELLPLLMSDRDETVRWSVALRLPINYLIEMRSDPDREVRIRVAARL